MTHGPLITTRWVRIDDVIVGDVVEYRSRDGSQDTNAWFAVADIIPPSGPGRRFQLFADKRFADLWRDEYDGSTPPSASASLTAAPLTLVRVQVEEDLYGRGQADAIEALESTNADLLRDAIDEAREAGRIP